MLGDPAQLLPAASANTLQIIRLYVLPFPNRNSTTNGTTVTLSHDPTHYTASATLSLQRRLFGALYNRPPLHAHVIPDLRILAMHCCWATFHGPHALQAVYALLLLGVHGLLSN